MKHCCCVALVALFAGSLSPTAYAGGGLSELASAFAFGVATPPTVVTLTPTNLTPTSVRFNGTANPNQLLSQAWFVWDLATPPPGDSSAKQAVGFGLTPVAYNATVTGLIPGTAYHVVAAGGNAAGRSYGNDVIFTTPPFTRDSAISKVLAQVINPSPYKNSLVAFLYDPPGPDSTLAPGTTVAPLDSEFVRTVPSRSWFFWIDLTGDIRFAHPCKFVYVDAATGAVTSDNGEWWPALTPPADTSVYPWESIDERKADSTSRVYGNYAGTALPPIMTPSAGFRVAPAERSTMMFYRSDGIMSGNTCGILVGGGAISKGEQNAWQNDLDSMKTLLSTPPPGGGSAMTNETQMKNNATKADLKKMIDTAAAHGCNSIIFYYSGHGGKTKGGYLYLKDKDVTYDSLAAWLNAGVALKFKNVILDNCYGGLAEPSFNTKPVPVTLITASDSTKTSSGSITYRDKNGNGVFDNGDSIVAGEGKYTGAYMKCWRKLRDSLNRNPTLKEIHDWVIKVNPDSIKQKQNPQSHKFTPPVSMTQNVTAPGHYDFLGTGVFIDFINIGGPFNVVVTKIYDPPPGLIDPGDLQLGILSQYSYWTIESFPPMTFIANVGLTLDSANELIPYSRLRIGTRPTPSIITPNPLWVNVFPANFIPGPGGGVTICQNIGHFSQWTYAESIEQITSVDVQVGDKWNMLSLPMNVANATKTALFPTASSTAYYFNDGYFPADTLEHCRGYWMKFPAATSVNIGGTQILRDTCPVASGWNLIGSVTKPLAVGDLTTIPSGIGLSAVFGYSNGYVQADSIRPGQGYWVKAAADAQLVFDVFPSAVPKRRLDDLSALNSVTFTDAAGYAQTLYLGEETNASRSLSKEMPPPPPRGAFDARFSSGSWVEFYPARSAVSREYPVSLSSAVYPVKVAWNVRPEGTSEISLNGGKKLVGSGSVQLAKDAPVVLRVGDAGVPQEFLLAQNYPNPFNPTTRIHYELPKDAFVTVSVYTLLGEKVAVLVDEQQSAGRYEVDVNAGGWASGVYFYRLQAGTYTGIQKMVLLK